MGNLTTYTNVRLLLPCNGANDGTSFVDLSKYSRTATASGNAKTSTGQYKYYDSSGLFDGTGDYLTVASVESLVTDDLSVGAWIRPATVGTGDRALFHFNAGGNGGLHVHLNAQTIVIDNGLSASGATGNVLTATTWQYLSVCLSAGNVYVGIDGTITQTKAQQTYTANTQIIVGRFSTGGIISDYNGYIQDVIVAKDDRFKTTFTPPSQLTGTISNAGSGVAAIKDDTDAAAIRRVWATQRLAADRVFSTTSNASGRYSLTVPHTEHAVIFEDNAAGSQLADILVSHVLPS